MIVFSLTLSISVFGFIILYGYSFDIDMFKYSNNFGLQYNNTKNSSDVIFFKKRFKNKIFDNS